MAQSVNNVPKPEWPHNSICPALRAPHSEKSLRAFCFQQILQYFRRACKVPWSRKCNYRNFWWAKLMWPWYWESWPRDAVQGKMRRLQRPAIQNSNAQGESWKEGGRVFHWFSQDILPCISRQPWAWYLTCLIFHSFKMGVMNTCLKHLLPWLSKMILEKHLTDYPGLTSHSKMLAAHLLSTNPLSHAHSAMLELAHAGAGSHWSWLGPVAYISSWYSRNIMLEICCGGSIYSVEIGKHYQPGLPHPLPSLESLRWNRYQHINR